MEFANVKNQEVTIKNLKDKIKELEASSEQQISLRLKEKEKELQRYYNEKEDQLQSTQMDLVKKLGETENVSLTYRSQMDQYQNELYDLKQKQDEMLSAKNCEMDILLQDLDKVTERAVNAERLLEQHKITFENTKKEMLDAKTNEFNQQQMDDMKLSSFRTSSLEIELVAKEKEISQLVDDIQNLHSKSNKAREAHESQLTRLRDELSSHEKSLENLRYELSQKNDYEELKRELNILKTIEFNFSVDDNADSEANKKNQPLEILLLEKNRQLQVEITHVKNKLSDVNQQLETTSKEHSEYKLSNGELKKLVGELEKDLLEIAKNQTVSSSLASQSDQMTVLSLERSESQAASSNIDLFGSNESKGGKDSSLFDIVSNQRERFRVRCQELETDNIANKQKILFVTNELDHLRTDNVKLYEKIKFLQSASGKKFSKAKRSDMEYDVDDHDERVLNKYTDAYESRLDPFSKFNYREKLKRYANLQLHDKFTLNLGRFILSNKMTRMLFCAYLLIIHLLIFFNLYHMAHHESAHRDLSLECANAYKEHMFEVHGNSKFIPPQ